MGSRARREHRKRAFTGTCPDGAFAHQTSLIRDRLLSGTILQSDETSARVT
jgi:hypothetical protein